VPFVKQLAAVLEVDAQAVRPLHLAEYQALAAELRATLAETAGVKARTRQLRAKLGRLLRVVVLLYDYLKTTALASRIVYKEYGGLLDGIDSARALVADISAGVDEERAGWDSKDMYKTMLADFG
jgi:hypothetical protein